MSRRRFWQKESGCFRAVFLIGPYALKFPQVRYGVEFFLRGLLSNYYEAQRWRKTRHPNLAPVLLCAPLGILLVMPRFYRILDRGLTPAELQTTSLKGMNNHGWNWAVYQHRFILIDYGNDGWYIDTAN